MDVIIHNSTSRANCDVSIGSISEKTALKRDRAVLNKPF